MHGLMGLDVPISVRGNKNMPDESYNKLLLSYCKENRNLCDMEVSCPEIEESGKEPIPFYTCEIIQCPHFKGSNFKSGQPYIMCSCEHDHKGGKNGL
jgi:hypothetical protein